ncbi:hypothetical protein WN944_022108 [Citrus x changshan-huyou]|uniref:Uncharacterized protein n=1 Tax=Citrus x changshan-huyou TaxID=2935761 RepID=A0AAP0N0N7_9ROSI
MSEESENVKDEMVDSEDSVEISKRLFAQKSSKWNCKFGASLENSKVKYKCDPGSKKRKKEELAEKNESGEFDLCDSLGEMGIRVTKRRRISAEGKKRAIRIATSLKLKNPKPWCDRCLSHQVRCDRSMSHQVLVRQIDYDRISLLPLSFAIAVG